MPDFLARLFRRLKILRVRYALWSWGVPESDENRRRWSAYVRTGDLKADDAKDV